MTEVPAARRVRDDRVLPLTRWSSVVILVALLAGGITLYGFPGSTGAVWAWTIEPHMTSLLLGAGYLSSAYFFARAAWSRHWHQIEAGFLGVTLFAVLLLIATLLHWGRFAHGHPVFWAWLALYVIGPVLVPTFWLRNRPYRTRVPSGPVVARPVRLLLGLIGAVQLVVALVLFVVPAWAIALWPWALTPLTAQVVAGFIAATAMTLLVSWWEPRRDALAAGLQTVALGALLIVVAVPRAVADFPSPAIGWGFGAALAVLLALTALPLVAAHQPSSTGAATAQAPS